MKKSSGTKKYFEGTKELPEFDSELDDSLKILAHIIAHRHIKKTLREKSSETSSNEGGKNK